MGLKICCMLVDQVDGVRFGPLNERDTRLANLEQRVATLEAENATLRNTIHNVSNV